MAAMTFSARGVSWNLMWTEDPELQTIDRKRNLIMLNSLAAKEQVEVIKTYFVSKPF